LKVCVFGAGAIGGYVGAELARTDVDVSMVARGAHLAAMREHGVRLQIDGEERVAHPRLTDVPSELGVQDYVIIALKAHAISDAVDADRRIDGIAALGVHRMSMLQDLERGRSMEIEPLVGVVQELGRLPDIPTPTIDVVLALIRQRARHV
jgi:ketopantoate reductase